MLQKIILIIPLIWAAFACSGQQLLFHKNRNKEVLYKPADIISFSTKDDHSRMTSQILGFEGDSLIVFQNYKINPRDITCMYVDEKTRGWYPLRYNIDKLLLIAGVGYPLLEFFNERILNGNSVDRNVVRVGGFLVGAGLMARLLISEKIKIKGRRKLLIIDR